MQHASRQIVDGGLQRGSTDEMGEDSVFGSSKVLLQLATSLEVPSPLDPLLHVIRSGGLDKSVRASAMYGRRPRHSLRMRVRASTSSARLESSRNRST